MRLQADHVGKSFIPAFYKFIKLQESEEAQAQAGREFQTSLDELVALLERAEKEVVEAGGVSGVGEKKALAAGLGLWIDGNEDLGWIDVMAGPCESLDIISACATPKLLIPGLYRADNVGKVYRGFAFPQEGKLARYLQKLFNHPDFKATCSTEEVYVDSYSRFAFPHVTSVFAE